jgi:hypothetical protein
LSISHNEKNTDTLWSTNYDREDFVKNTPNGNLYINNEVVSNVVVPKEITNFNGFYGWGIGGTFEFEDGSTLEKITQIPYCNILKLPKGTYTLNNHFFQSNSAPLPSEIHFEGTMTDYLKLTFSNQGIFASPSKIYLNNELIEKIVIPTGVISIPSKAFYYYNITFDNIIISETVANIEAMAFYGSTSSWTTPAPIMTTIIRLLGTTPPTIQSNSFADSAVIKYIVPASALETYKTATNWSTRASKIYADVNASLNIDSTLLNNENIFYSIDGGEKQQFTSASLSLENIGTLTIHNTSTDTINLGTTNGGTEIGTSGANTTITYTFTADTTIYITKA